MKHRRRGAKAAAVVMIAAAATAAAVALAHHPAPHGAISSATDPCHPKTQTFCVLNPDVQQSTIAQTICTAGWTATIRPPTSFTTMLKTQQIATEQLSDTNPADYEEDHRMPLELGGAARDPLNLTPELHPGSSAKDADENAFKRDVCSKAKTLQQAQNEFVTKWLLKYPGYRQ